MIRLITDTVGDGGCIFVGDNSVLPGWPTARTRTNQRRGHASERTNGADTPYGADAPSGMGAPSK